jgi:hypothetical protein
MTLDSSTIFTALDSAGLVYDVRHANSGTPYASFRWEYPPASAMLRAFTILHEAETLRISLHEPMGTDARLSVAECFERQDDFPVARLYTNHDDADKLELCIAIPMQGITPDIELLKTLMIHLTHNADELLGTTKVSSRQAPALPAMQPEILLADVLCKLGLHPTQQQGAFVVDINLPGIEPKARFQVYHLATGWVRVTAHLREDNYLEIDQLPDALISQLQLWAPTGRFVSVKTEAGQLLGCEVAAIFMGRHANVVIAEAMRAATQLLGTACKQLKNED